MLSVYLLITFATLALFSSSATVIVLWHFDLIVFPSVSWYYTIQAICSATGLFTAISIANMFARVAAIN